MPTGTYPHFLIRFPSPSTISYTVSSLAFPRSLPISILRHTFRLAVSLCAFFALLVKARLTGLTATLVRGEEIGVDAFVDVLLGYGTVGERMGRAVEGANWWVVVGGCVVVLGLCLRRDYTEETLLVLQGLGIQTSTSSPFWLMAPTTTFIPTTRIQDIVIHEAFKGFGVRFYLAVIVEGATEVVVVFPRLLPRRPILEEVWRGSRKCLYGGAG